MHLTYLLHIKCKLKPAAHLSVESSGYGSCDAGLSHTWRPMKTQDLALRVGLQLAHCNEFL
jgi:hypothetical protein